LDRQIRGIQREELKVKASLKQAAKRGDKDVCVILAKEIVRARKAVNRINTSKTQLNSVSLHMNQQAANLRVAGAMEKSAEVMKCMHNLVKVQEISAVMQELSKEMMRAGIIEEMMEDTMENISGMDEEEMEEEAQAEVDKVLFELTAGQLGAAPSAVSDSLPSTSTVKTKEPVEEEEDQEEIEEMKKRLEALKS
jgi:charged multivesicular body protein 3